MFTENRFDGQNHELIAAQKEFHAELDKKVAEIVESLPATLRPIIMQAAEELEKNLPDELRGADSVTHDELDQRAIYMRLLFKVSNALGRGASWLRE
ncbi:hypothetical protein OZH73_24625 [Escherichia coli]|uniref:hypothetical protein n=1 Tax=Escherichia coli TaxID=562 RepID=UPI002283C47C|nr:hypothetical protein [Escherichia coli]MCZ0520476.1 hypothetical protein [Escherichia coli]